MTFVRVRFADLSAKRFPTFKAATPDACAMIETLGPPLEVRQQHRVAYPPAPPSPTRRPRRPRQLLFLQTPSRSGSTSRTLLSISAPCVFELHAEVGSADAPEIFRMRAYLLQLESRASSVATLTAPRRRGEEGSRCAPPSSARRAEVAFPRSSIRS